MRTERFKIVNIVSSLGKGSKFPAFPSPRLVALHHSFALLFVLPLIAYSLSPFCHTLSFSFPSLSYSTVTLSLILCLPSSFHFVSFFILRPFSLSPSYRTLTLSLFLSACFFPLLILLHHSNHLLSHYFSVCLFLLYIISLCFSYWLFSSEDMCGSSLSPLCAPFLILFFFLDSIMIFCCFTSHHLEPQ